MTDAEQAQALLRELLPVGSTARTILRHVSRSGMTRHLSVVVNTPDGVRDITYYVAELTGYRLVDSHGARALKVGGCGMDMGFAVIYSLSRTLYPNGHACIGREPVRCPSNDHSNDYGALARQYAEELGAEYDHDTYEARSAYCSARAAWMETQEARLWSPERIHTDGGYAINHGWL